MKGFFQKADSKAAIIHEQSLSESSQQGILISLLKVW